MPHPAQSSPDFLDERPTLHQQICADMPAADNRGSAFAGHVLAGGLPWLFPLCCCTYVMLPAF
jgi:hypothetical protein